VRLKERRSSGGSPRTRPFNRAYCSRKSLCYRTKIRFSTPAHVGMRVSCAYSSTVKNAGSIESIPFSKFENFAGRIFEISRKYMGATRPSPLLTDTTDARMSILLWSISLVVRRRTTPAPNLATSHTNFNTSPAAPSADIDSTKYATPLSSYVGYGMPMATVFIIKK
jgi:hypothetical protein